MQRMCSHWFVTCAVFLLAGACQVTYDVAPGVDAGPTPDATQSDTATPQKPPLPLGMIEQLNFPCDRWAKGKPLQLPPPSVKATLGTLTSRLWNNDSASVQAAQIYLPILSSGTTGDLYCVVLSMLQEKLAFDGVGAFYDYWLSLQKIVPKSSRYPEFNEVRIAKMAQDARDLAVRLSVGRSLPFSGLFSERRPLQIAADSPSLSPDDPWLLGLQGMGLLSEPGVLAALSGSESTISARGQRIRQTFLCDGAPPDIAGGSTVPPPPKGVSYRSAHQSTVQSITCSGCHDRIDGFGIAMDVFDSVGQVHSLDRYGFKFDLVAKTVSPSGEPVELSSPGALGKYLSNSLDARICYLRKWIDYVNAENPMSSLPVEDAVLRQTVSEMKDDVRIDHLIASAFEIAFDPTNPK